ncbi:hypothetical protein ACVXZ4_04190 [Lacisediminihabitans sp. FW035]
MNKFAQANTPGSYSLMESTLFAQPFETRLLRVRHGETWASFTVTREPISCYWLVLPFGGRAVAGTDVWDILYASDQHAYETQQEAVEGTLISFGYLHPGIGSVAGAYRIRALREQAAAQWMSLWLDDRDLDTTVCSGCDQCGWGEERAFHRVELAGEIGG